MEITPFEYMAWAKAEGAGTGHRLTRSGLLPPPLELLQPLEPLWELAELDPYGPPALKERLAARAAIAPDRVFLVAGSSSMALFLVGLVLLEPGDLVLAEQPGYEALSRFAQFPRARVEPLPRDPARGWRPDLEALAAGLDRGAAMVVLTDLHNPTGLALEATDLEEILALTEAAGAWLVVDRVFAEFLPPHRRLPEPAARGDRVVTMASFTKAFGLGSLRQGWIFAAPEVVRRCQQAYDLMGVLPPTMPLHLLDRVLDREESIRRWADGVLAGLDRDLDRLAAHPALDFPRPRGGVSIFPALAGQEDTEACCSWLAAERDVHVTPGRFFGDPSRIRIGLGLEPEPRRQALDALLAGLDAWPGQAGPPPPPSS